MAPEITEAEVDSARRLAESIYNALRSGAPIDSLQRLHHEKGEEREGKDVPLTKLPPAYAQAIGTTAEGEVVAPFPVPGSNGRTRFAVLQITSRRPEGDVRYEDVRDKIRAQLGEQLAIRRYLDRLRKSAYVEIRGRQAEGESREIGRH